MKKALIVDDSKDNLLLLQTILKKDGYDVMTALNGVRALEQARRLPPDIIISDILMPEMDGFTLCREWQKDERLKKIPFVFYTATYTDSRDKKLALSLGAVKFIIKPKEPSEFISLIRDAVEGRGAGFPEAKEVTVEEKDYYRLYSEALIRKLEDKMLRLEKLNMELEKEIADRKIMEEELLKTQKLESVGILAGGIAHDFNNILTSISGNISMAKMEVKPGHKIFDLLSAAEKASIRAQGLTRQLLTFARGGTPVKETVTIQSLVIESSLFVLQGSKSVCEFQMAENLWPVEADVGQISQVVSNIVINANQAMPEGGIIRIAAENLKPEMIHEISVKPGRYVRISIKDQGVGIVEKHLSKIFDPYFTTKQAGSGLGLATAYSIIKKHNGHLSVNSLLGTGTTFDIYLPASDKEIPAKEEPVMMKGEGKILMMDDDEFLKELAKEMLDMLGYESEFAKNGDEAVVMYRKAIESGKPYDAVILDLTIPGGMGGKEVIKILLEIDPKVKAIVFSGYSDDEVMSNYREYGFKGMMPKPFDTYKLGKALKDVLK